jgi:hypothetical protein
MMKTLKQSYTVKMVVDDEDFETYYLVLDADGDEVDSFENEADAILEADERNTNLAIEATIEAMQDSLYELTECRKASTLEALRAMARTLAKLVATEE